MCVHNLVNVNQTKLMQRRSMRQFYSTLGLFNYPKKWVEFFVRSSLKIHYGKKGLLEMLECWLSDKKVIHSNDANLK